jgi:DNA repair exonuclease SbcCD ATPase subunit
VRYNEQTHAFTPVSADDVRADNARHAAMQDVEQFRKLYTDLVNDSSLKDAHKTQLYTKLITMIEDRLDQIKASRPQGAISPPSSSNMVGTNPTDIDLIKFEKQLSAIESKLGEATTHFVSTQSTLDEAKKKVADIIANLTSAKAALTSPDTSTGKSKQDIETLTTELTAAEQALITAQTDRNAAKEQVTGLTKESRDVKTAIMKAHQDLTEAKDHTVTSLGALKQKVEGLLKELGVATTTLPTNPRTAACGGKPSENKYYLLGPEGSKELDPNDRLLLALSVDSKPLISALQQLSDRKFQPAGTNYQAMEDLLQERGYILDSRSILQKAEKDAGAESTDQSKLKTLLDELRRLYVTRNATEPAK